MSERKVQDAIDLKTKEKIFFKGHAKATYMSDGTTVEDAINQSMGSGSEKLVVSVSGITEGFTVYVMSEDGDVIGSQSTNYKTYRIKEGVRYYVMAGEAVGAITPNKSETFTAYAYAEREIEMVYEPPKVTTIRIDQNISDPTTMITRIIDGGGIEAIRANSHRYTGTFADGVMTLKQLEDNDGTKYLDGTAATLTTIGTDVWMKLPRFFWKCTEYATDIWDFSVAYGIKPDTTFKEWDGKDLIGVYEAFNNAKGLYSISNQSPSQYTSKTNLNYFAVQRGEGFSLVKWKHHCMMAMLFYTWYNHTNSQAIVGLGTNSVKNTGQTDSLGMDDTVGNGGNGDSNSINFWGLENWWGNKYEIMDNVFAGKYNGERLMKIVEDGVTRTVTFVFHGSYIRKFFFGENIDLSVQEGNASDSTGFCDYLDSPSMIDYEYSLVRSGNVNSPYAGVSYLNATLVESSENQNVTSRLAFRGEIVIES